MKHVVTYKLPEDRFALHTSLRGMHYLFALHELRDYFRRLNKYHEEDTISIEEVTKKFYEILENENINLTWEDNQDG
jgi:hypothetical protein